MKRIFIFSVFLVTPAVSLAVSNLDDLLNQVLLPLLQLALPLVLAFALFGFLWGGMLLIWNAGNEKRRAQGKHVLFWGVIGLFCAFSLYGLVALLQGTFGFTTGTLTVPSAQLPGEGY